MALHFSTARCDCGANLHALEGAEYEQVSSEAAAAVGYHENAGTQIVVEHKDGSTETAWLALKSGNAITCPRCRRPLLLRQTADQAELN